MAAVREEAQRVVDVCKEFVRAMARVESELPAMAKTLTKEEREEVIREVLAFLGSDEVRGPFTKEIARELIAQMSASAMYSDYAGSTDSYIQ